MKKLKIGVSACLIGLKYRYDGTSKTDKNLIRLLNDKFDFVPVCPECECGLPVPRPKMHLITSPKGIRMKEIEADFDHTDKLFGWAEVKLEQLSKRRLAGFIFKSSSPSCGLRSTKLFSPNGRCISEHESGLFARLYTQRFPHLLVTDEKNLDEFMKKMNFSEQNSEL